MLTEEIYHEARGEFFDYLQDYNRERKPQDFLVAKFPLDDFLRQALYRRLDSLAIRAKTMAEHENNPIFPIQNQAQRLILTQLFHGVLLCGRLANRALKYRSTNLYEDFEHQYKLELWRFICTNIKKFNPERKKDLERSQFVILLNSCSQGIFYEGLFKIIGNNVDLRPQYQSSKGENKYFQMIPMDELHHEILVSNENLSLSEG